MSEIFKTREEAVRALLKLGYQSDEANEEVRQEILDGLNNHWPKSSWAQKRMRKWASEFVKSIEDGR